MPLRTLTDLLHFCSSCEHFLFEKVSSHVAFVWPLTNSGKGAVVPFASNWKNWVMTTSRSLQSREPPSRNPISCDVAHLLTAITAQKQTRTVLIASHVPPKKSATTSKLCADNLEKIRPSCPLRHLWFNLPRKPRERSVRCAPHGSTVSIIRTILRLVSSMVPERLQREGPPHCILQHALNAFLLLT